MFKRNLQAALRNQLKNKAFSIINILGLAIGISVSILIINFVSFEFSFDNMHSKQNRIYRVESLFYEGDVKTDEWATSSFGYGSAMNREMTGIENYVRIGVQNSEQTVSYKEIRARENGIAYTGPSFFSVFDFKLKEGASQEQQRLYEMLSVDETFIEVFGFEILAGRSFQKGFGNELESLVINEAAMSNLGLTNPGEAIGKKVMLEGETEPVTIIGVLKNWHQRGLGNAYTPIMLLRNSRLSWVPPRFIVIKTAGKQYDKNLDLIQKRWKSYFPEASFDYFFLDSFFNNQYKADKRFGKIITIFTGLAFFISVLGLWGLAAFTALKKVKDAGVRKIFGARAGNIIYLFSREIVVLILIALCIATPVSIIVMKNWLLNYAFHITIPYLIYVAGGIITISIAMITVGWQSWRAARRNPVEALRYE